MKYHWPEYFAEAFCLGVFMVAAGVMGTLLESPLSPIHQRVVDPLFRRTLMGCFMGFTAIAIIYSPPGKQSGAHMNPAVTLSFFSLGKIRFADAAMYVCAQFMGGTLGICVVWWMFKGAFSNPPVMFVATLPGTSGTLWAFLAEAAMSFVLFAAVLALNSNSWSTRYTGIVAGSLVALFITVEAPISGMSINPARSFASAVPGGIWHSLWIYFLAPTIGMLTAAVLLTRLGSGGCAKLIHASDYRCIFCGHTPSRTN